jgi:hypothetical protein
MESLICAASVSGGTGVVVKKKSLFVLIFAFMVWILISGCEIAEPASTEELADNYVLETEITQEFIKGYVEGRVGKIYSTRWFDFEIISMEHVDSYSTEYRGDSWIMLDVIVEETNTSDKFIGMGTFDFYAAIDVFPDIENALYKLYPNDPFPDDTDTMMPLEFELAPGETVRYHMIFEYPNEVRGAQLVYTEIDEYDNEGATVSIPIPEMDE